MKLTWTLENFIRAYLPPEDRKDNIISYHKMLLKPLDTLVQDYLAWRDEELIKSVVSAEKGSLEWYLNYRFDPVDQQIYIVRNQGVGIEIGIDEATEPAYYAYVGIDFATEPASYEDIPLKGEDVTVGIYKFGVFIPTALSALTDEIRGVVNVYNSSDKDYTIIEF